MFFLVSLKFKKRYFHCPVEALSQKATKTSWFILVWLTWLINFDNFFCIFYNLENLEARYTYKDGAVFWNTFWNHRHIICWKKLTWFWREKWSNTKSFTDILSNRATVSMPWERRENSKNNEGTFSNCFQTQFRAIPTKYDQTNPGTQFWSLSVGGRTTLASLQSVGIELCLIPWTTTLVPKGQTSAGPDVERGWRSKSQKKASFWCVSGRAKVYRCQGSTPIVSTDFHR